MPSVGEKAIVSHYSLARDEVFMAAGPIAILFTLQPHPDLRQMP